MNSHKTESDSIKTILNEKADWFQNLQIGLKEREQLKQLWQTIIPMELNRFGQLIKFKAGVAVIAADNAAYASRLIMQRPNIMQLLKNQAQFHDLEQIKVIVLPLDQSVSEAAPNTSTSTATIKPLSNSAKRYLKTSAKHIKDPELRAALERLANK